MEGQIMSNENLKTLSIERSMLAAQEIRMILRAHGVTLEADGGYIALRCHYRIEGGDVRRVDVPFKPISE